MSAFSRSETAIVVEARKGKGGAKALSELLVVSEITLDAWRRYGKGRHTAGLNMGDCAAYALASPMNLPLLFKGDYFTKTDIAEA